MAGLKITPTITGVPTGSDSSMRGADNWENFARQLRGRARAPGGGGGARKGELKSTRTQINLQLARPSGLAAGRGGGWRVAEKDAEENSPRENFSLVMTGTPVFLKQNEMHRTVDA